MYYLFEAAEIRAMSVEPTAPCDGPNCSPSALTNRTELDDILDEILADVMFAQDLRSPNQESIDPSSAQEPTGGRSDSIHANEGTTPPSNGWKFRDNPAYERTPLTDHRDGQCAQYATSSATGEGAEGFPGWIESNGMATGGRPRAPSLPVNWSGEDQRPRYQSIPYSDYYYSGGQTPPSRGPVSHDRQSGRFVRWLCSSDEPSAWLDRQKVKLESLNERRRSLHESNQRRQLMEELKIAQKAYAQRRRARCPDDDPDEFDALPRVGPTHAGRPDFESRRSSLPSSERRLPDFRNLLRPDAGLRSDELFKSEKNYYVSGIERPPFTTHQTKYIFKVSTPHTPYASPDGGRPGIRPNAKPGPPTPKRASSRGAMRQSLVHDWALDQWEQGKVSQRYRISRAFF